MMKPFSVEESQKMFSTFLTRRNLDGPQNEMTVPEDQKDPMTEYDVQILPEDQKSLTKKV